MGVLANLGTGAVLDLPIAQSTKSRSVFVVIATAITACWIWNAVVEAELTEGLTATSSAFDIGQTGSAASAFAVYMSKRFIFAIFPCPYNSFPTVPLAGGQFVLDRERA